MVAFALAWPAQSRAQSYLYWSWYDPASNGSGTIARAELDGTHIEQRFITDTSEPQAIAVNRSDIFWADNNTYGRHREDDSDSIGRARLNGTHATHGLVSGIHDIGPIAADGTHVYWYDGRRDAIGRARLDGTHVDRRLIRHATANVTGQIVLAGSHMFWACPTGICRAGLRGPVHADRRFISSFAGGQNTVGGIGSNLAADRSHLYWVQAEGSRTLRPSLSIARANLDGTQVERRYISRVSVHGYMVIHGNYIYWTDARGRIIRANAYGPHTIDRRFITDLGAGGANLFGLSTSP